MNYRISLFLFFVLVNSLLFSQEKQLTFIDAVNPAFIPSYLSQLSWQGGSEVFAYVDNEKNILMQGNTKGETKPLLSLDQLNQYIEGDDLTRFPRITWHTGDQFYFLHANGLHSYAISSRTFTTHAKLEKGAEHIEVSPTLDVAFTVDGNLYVCPEGRTNPIQVTTQGKFDIVYGEPASRNEFGINAGIFWSPKGNKVCFYKIDQSKVGNYPLINYMEPLAEFTPIKYPMAGTPSQHVSLGVYDLDENLTYYLETTRLDEEAYLTNVTWAPDAKTIYVAAVNRDQNQMDLNAYRAKNGKYLKTLFTETHEKYVEPEHGPMFFPMSTDKFLWLSERDGYQHIYVYNTSGNMTRQLTSGEWEVTSILGIDEDEENVFFMGTKEGPLETHAYKVSLANASLTRLTKEKGTHLCKLTEAGRYLIDIYSNRKVPRATQIIDTKKQKLTATLLLSPNPLKEYQLGKLSISSLKEPGGQTLYTRTILPPDFDSTKQYPAVVYVYGGPHVQLIREEWLGGARLFLQMLAQKGYVVFTLDNRGSSHRGLGFEQETFRRMGTPEVEDQLAGVKYLKGLPFVDTTRIGVHGWSYGGFMTTSLLLKSPGTFKVGVAGGPVIDWKYYEIMYTERYMDSPEQNPDGYKESSLLTYAQNLEDRLLIIHGLQDDVVVPQHSRVFVRECIKLRKQLDYFPYPTHQHNVLGIDRAHLYEKIYRYFEEHL
ncbi:MAG: DPP IV N-terminal domain-containing protein [Bacteroidota bacterium]